MASYGASGEGGSGSLLSYIKHGIGFGIGAFFAHKVMSVLIGPPAIRCVPPASPASPKYAIYRSNTIGKGVSNPCDAPFKKLLACLNSSISDISKCQSHMEKLQECHKNNSDATFVFERHHGA